MCHKNAFVFRACLLTTADLSPGRMNLALAAGPFHLLPVTDQDVNQFIFEISEQIRARYVMNGEGKGSKNPGTETFRGGGFR